MAITRNEHNAGQHSQNDQKIVDPKKVDTKLDLAPERDNDKYGKIKEQIKVPVMIYDETDFDAGIRVRKFDNGSVMTTRVSKAPEQQSQEQIKREEIEAVIAAEKETMRKDIMAELLADADFIAAVKNAPEGEKTEGGDK